LWRFRGLFWALAVRDIKVKYRQTVIGVAWALIQPLATALVFVFLFGLLGHVPTDGDRPYGLFVLPGVILWQLFATVLTQATNSLVANQNLIAKVYFPRILLPASAAVPALADFGVGLVVVAGVMACFATAPGWPVLTAPLFILLGLLTALAAGAWASALNAIYRDTGFAIPFVLQIGFFVSPVVYATDALIPERWRPLLALNPMTGVLEGFRWSLFGGAFPAKTVLIGAAMTALVLVSGLWYFRRVEGYLADRI
jgi:lipopolysaccharide transport system permease protein